MKFYEPPPPVGCWVIGGGMRVYLPKRPRWLTRVLCRILLEWHWSDQVYERP